LSVEFEIIETTEYRKSIVKPHFAVLYPKIVDFVYPQLRRNPYFGPNIKKLKGELSAFYWYRIGSFRLLYHIEGDKTIVLMVTVTDRKDAY
jgi:mRNA interferase RelE/StbE